MFNYHGKMTDQMLLTEGPASFHPVSRASRVYAPALWSGWKLFVKRALDIVVATLGLTLGSPVLLGIALVIRLESPGPALFRQRRIGLNGCPFELLKFRTMYHHADDAERASGVGLRQVTRHDPRVTRFGACLRHLSFDELPQLINMLRGEMSLVGPRPHAPGSRAGGRLFEEVTPLYAERHRIRPGMTGLAQVRGWRGETDTEHKLLKRIECDLEYIDTWSLALDTAIVWRTIFAVLRMRNAY